MILFWLVHALPIARPVGGACHRWAREWNVVILVSGGSAVFQEDANFKLISFKRTEAESLSNINTTWRVTIASITMNDVLFICFSTLVVMARRISEWNVYQTVLPVPLAITRQNEWDTVSHLQLLVPVESAYKNAHTNDMRQRTLLTCTKPRSHSWSIWQVCHLPCRGNGTLGQILANSPFALSANVTQVNYQSWCLYKGAEKSLARPTSRCILFDGENISFDARLVCINSINNPPIMIINRIYEHKNLLSL